MGAAIIAATAAAAAERPAHAGYAAFVVDAASGGVLHSENADEPRYPASLTKMMTLYLVFESLDHGVVSLDTKLPVSRRAAGRPPSKIGLRAGEKIALGDAVRLMAVKSANDVATTIAEYFSGSETAFAQLMTNRARAMGMRSTTFRNASGLPDRRQRTTARDVATLALAIYERFPHYAHFFATRHASWRGKRYRNTNRLLGAYPGMNGIKTGYISASGFNLAASVERDGFHIVAVVMGGKTSQRRNARMRTLLDRALADAGRSRDFLASVRRPRPKPAIIGATGAPAATTASAAVADAGLRIDVAATPAAGGGAWSIQLGAYSERDAAERILEVANFVVPGLAAGGERRIEAVTGRQGVLYRARQTGLGEDEARRACGEIKRHNLPCLVVPTPTS